MTTPRLRSPPRTAQAWYRLSREQVATMSCQDFVVVMPTLRLLGGETFNMKVTSPAKRAVTFQPIA